MRQHDDLLLMEAPPKKINGGSTTKFGSFFQSSRPPATMAKATSTGGQPPDLHHAVKVLTSINSQNKTPKEIGEIYVASLAILYHLKLDQATIRSIRSVFVFTVLLEYGNVLPEI